MSVTATHNGEFGRAEVFFDDDGGIHAIAYDTSDKQMAYAYSGFEASDALHALAEKLAAIETLHD